MKINSGYLSNHDEDVENTQYDIAINSCGRYELIKQKEFETRRPGGRVDFQLLYVAKGIATFTFNGNEQVVKEGTIVVYIPGEDQDYSYNILDSPIVYWLHFSGSNALNLLKENNLASGNIFFIGTNNDFSLIFDKIIKELQSKQANYFQMCNLFIKELFTLSSRYLKEVTYSTYKQNKLIESAINYFNENSNTAINIKEYANNCNISCCWFIRSFKSYTGTTPTQYITNIRINKAKNLLNGGSFTVSEISNLIGYDNPLYFSRIFKKNVGVSPTDYSLPKKQLSLK